MSIASLFEVIADKVHEKGYDKGELDFWNCFTNNGKRSNYYFSFMNTDFSNKIIPEGLCKPSKRVMAMFTQYSGKYLPNGIDCSEFDVSLTADMHANQLFNYAMSLLEIPDIGLPAQKTYERAFSGCSSLVSIAVIRSNADTIWKSTFTGSHKLESLSIEGVIGKNGFDISDTQRINKASLLSIIKALEDKTEDTSGTTWKVTLGAVNVAKLTDDEINIIYEKGWDYA